jgi:hypothetical protein
MYAQVPVLSLESQLLNHHSCAPTSLAELTSSHVP